MVKRVGMAQQRRRSRESASIVATQGTSPETATSALRTKEHEAKGHMVEETKRRCRRLAWQRSKLDGPQQQRPMKPWPSWE